jgi:hypothetical protein
MVEGYQGRDLVEQALGLVGVTGSQLLERDGTVDRAMTAPPPHRGFGARAHQALYEDTNHASGAGYSTNVASFSAFDHERLVVAQGQLIAAVHTEQSGDPLTTEQAEYIHHASEMLGQPYVDALRAAANGLPANPVSITPRQLQEWAGSTTLDDGYTDVSNYSDLILPQDGTSLWPH